MKPSARYEVRLLREVKAALDGLDDDAFFPLAREIDSLAFAPRREDAEELGEGFWVLRTGELAVIYAVDDDRRVVVLVRVGRQDEILAEGDQPLRPGPPGE